MTRQLGNLVSFPLDAVAANRRIRVKAAGRRATGAVGLVFGAMWGLRPPPGEQRSFSVIPLPPWCARCRAFLAFSSSIHLSKLGWERGCKKLRTQTFSSFEASIHD